MSPTRPRTRSGVRRVSLPRGYTGSGRIPTHTEPGVEPPPNPNPPPSDFEVEGWYGYAAVLSDAGSGAVQVTSTGAEDFCTLQSEDTLLPTSRVGRVYSASVRVKAVDAGTAGRPLALVFRERLSNGSALQATTTINLTTGYQTVAVEYTGTEQGAAIDLRASLRESVAGQAFVVEHVPDWEYEDPTPTEPGSGSGGGPVIVVGDAFDYPFDPLALVNQKVTTRAVHAESAQAVERLLACIHQSKVNTLNGGESPPIYRSNHTTHVQWRIQYGSYSEIWYGPSNMASGGGSDYPLVIRDDDHPVHGECTEVRLWQANIPTSGAFPRTITASGFGLFHYNNDGAKLGGVRSVGRPFQGAGAGNGLTYTAGMVRPVEVQAGVIPHVLRFSYGPGGKTASSPTSSAFTPPATKSDQNGQSANGYVVPMGARFRLKASVDISTRTVPGKGPSAPETRFLHMICKALQDYGMMISDGTGGGPGLYMESQVTAPWSSLIGDSQNSQYGWILRSNAVPSPDNGITRTATDGVPWDQMELLAHDSVEVLT